MNTPSHQQRNNDTSRLAKTSPNNASLGADAIDVSSKTTQRGFFRFGKRHWKLLAISLSLSLLVLWLVSLLNPTTAQLGAARVITPVAACVETHRLLFLLWHILLIGAIYGLWGHKVNTALKQGLLTTKEAVFVREIRWLLIACLFAIDYFLLR